MIVVLKEAYCGPGQYLDPGTTVDLPDDVAKHLLARARAVVAEAVADEPPPPALPVAALVAVPGITPPTTKRPASRRRTNAG